jgi:hypothetical protein
MENIHCSTEIFVNASPTSTNFIDQQKKNYWLQLQGFGPDYGLGSSGSP